MGSETRAQSVYMYFQEVTNSRLDPRTFMPSSNIGIILVAVIEHHCFVTGVASYVADRLHVCYNWNASLEHGSSRIIICGNCIPHCEFLDTPFIAWVHRR